MTEEIEQKEAETEAPEVQAAEQEQAEPVAQEQNTEGAEQAQPEESDAERNWREFREGRKRDREQAAQAQAKAEEEAKAREALQQYLSQQLQNTGMQGQMTPAQQEQAIAELNPDDIPTGGEIQAWFDTQVKKVIQQEVQQKLTETQRQKERAQIGTELNSRMPDYWDVVNQENLDYLAYAAPALAKTVEKQLSDPNNVTLADLESAYQAVKMVVPNTKATQDRQRQEQGDARPRSMSEAAGSSRDTAPQRLTEARRKQLLQEMREAARMV